MNKYEDFCELKEYLGSEKIIEEFLCYFDGYALDRFVESVATDYDFW